MTLRNKKIILSSVVLLVLAGISIFTVYIKTQQNKAADNNSVKKQYKIYKNETIGFEFELPDGFEVSDDIYSERYNVRLFSEGGPIGDNVVFKRPVDEYIILFHIKSYDGNLLDYFDEAHKGDRVLIDGVENISSDKMIITHSLGKILIFGVPNSNDYFEIHMSRDFDSMEDALKQMIRTFRKY